MMQFRHLVLVILIVGTAACQQSLPTESQSVGDEPGVESLVQGSTADAKAALSPELRRLVAQIDEFNATLAAAGSDLRLEYPWFFVIGRGVDPFARLRTGARWVQTEISYIIDESDHTADAPLADVDAAVVAGFETWDAAPRAGISSTRQADPGGNFDILDGTIIGGDCPTVFDLTSPNFDPSTGSITPEADVVFGGWLSPEYFVECLGNASILGVTWFFSGGDTNGDNYADQNYVEQYYNDGFLWGTSGSQFLNFGTPIDIESIVLHEVGHTHGLGHFGGPVNRQPFTLKPNGRVFNPEAVMNPFYLNGEKRDLLSTDLAAFSTLYSRN